MSCTGSKPESGRQAGAVDSARPALEGVVLRHDRWDYVLPESDPFHAHEPDAQPCPSVGYKAENGFFELETDYCAIASFSQPIPVEKLGDYFCWLLSFPLLNWLHAQPP